MVSRYGNQYLFPNEELVECFLCFHLYLLFLFLSYLLYINRGHLPKISEYKHLNISIFPNILSYPSSFNSYEPVISYIVIYYIFAIPPSLTTNERKFFLLCHLRPFAIILRSFDQDIGRS